MGTQITTTLRVRQFNQAEFQYYVVVLDELIVLLFVADDNALF